jgi:hypothetical protein
VQKLHPIFVLTDPPLDELAFFGHELGKFIFEEDTVIGFDVRQDKPVEVRAL